jgi:hypothetical protein
MDAALEIVGDPEKIGKDLKVQWQKNWWDKFLRSENVGALVFVLMMWAFSRSISMDATIEYSYLWLLHVIFHCAGSAVFWELTRYSPVITQRVPPTGLFLLQRIWGFFRYFYPVKEKGISLPALFSFYTVYYAYGVTHSHRGYDMLWAILMHFMALALLWNRQRSLHFRFRMSL